MIHSHPREMTLETLLDKAQYSDYTFVKLLQKIDFLKVKQYIFGYNASNRSPFYT